MKTSLSGILGFHAARNEPGAPQAEASRAIFLNLRTTISRFRRDRKSMISLPLRWSISCWMAVASNPSAAQLAWFAVAVDVADDEARGAFDLDVVVRDRQAAFLVDARLGRPSS